MNHAAFKQAKQFVFQDVRREISLAKVSDTTSGKEALQGLGVQPGGGNFMAALALLCYTEFAGKLKYGSNYASKNFNRFFDELGPEYKTFRSSHNVYDIFRCGLAHEYYTKRSCTIKMVGPSGQPGIGQCPNGRYYFVVEPYCQDLERAFDALERHLYGEPPTM